MSNRPVVPSRTRAQPTGYTYDPVGNRLTSTKGPSTTTFSYDKADRGPRADANGNEVDGTLYGYDQANRLTSAATAPPASYIYDGDGVRTRICDPCTDLTLYDVNGSLPVVLEDRGYKFVWGNGLAYAIDNSGNVLGVFHADGLGSIRATTDANGNVSHTYQYDEFGVAIPGQAPTLGLPFGFAGQYYDVESGLYYLRARHYDPASGRFLERDTVFGSVSDSLSLNRYIYGNDNPVRNVDPGGREWGPNPECAPSSDTQSCGGAVVVGGGSDGGSVGDGGSGDANSDPNVEPGPSTTSQVTAQSYGPACGNYVCVGDALPEYVDGGPTSGIFVAGGDQTPVTSGKQGPASTMPWDTPGMRGNFYVRDHAEAQAAAIMRASGIRNADLWINKPGGPCPGTLGCDALLPHMLPEGATLTVYYPQGGVWASKTYVGVPDSQWVWPRN